MNQQSISRMAHPPLKMELIYMCFWNVFNPNGAGLLDVA